MNRDYVPFLFVLVVAVCVATPFLLSAPSSGSAGEAAAVGAWLSGELKLIGGLMGLGALVGGGLLLAGRLLNRAAPEVEQLVMDELPPPHAATATRHSSTVNPWEGVTQAVVGELLGNTRYPDPSYAQRELLGAIRKLKGRAKQAGGLEEVNAELLEEIGIAEVQLHAVQAELAAVQADAPDWVAVLALLLDTDATGINTQETLLRGEGVTVPKAARPLLGRVGQLKRAQAPPSPAAPPHTLENAVLVEGHGAGHGHEAGHGVGHEAGHGRVNAQREAANT